VSGDEDVLYDVLDGIGRDTATMGRSPDESEVLAVDAIERAHPPQNSPPATESVTTDSKF